MMQMVHAIDKPPDIDKDFYHDGESSSSSKEQQLLSDAFPPLEIVRKMIEYETKLRLSEPIQQLFDLYHTDDTAVTYVYYYSKYKKNVFFK